MMFMLMMAVFSFLSFFQPSFPLRFITMVMRIIMGIVTMMRMMNGIMVTSYANGPLSPP